MNIKILLTAIFLCLPLFILAQDGSWQLIYHNSKNGDRLNGNIDELIEAVRASKPIRIYWYHQSPSKKYIKVEHNTDAKFLTIMSDSIVYAQINPIVGQIPDFDKREMILKENLEWSFLASSNGKCDAMTRNTVTGEIISHEMFELEVKWFVKK